MVIHRIATEVHGRYLVDSPQGHGPFPLLVGFHGYGELAGSMLESLARIRAEREWTLVSVQALNRFYTRANDVVANWMTREDRDHAIADNVAYVAAVVAAVRAEYPLHGRSRLCRLFAGRGHGLSRGRVRAPGRCYSPRRWRNHARRRYST